MRWVFLACATWPTAKKMADLVRLCIAMCRSPGEIGQGSAHAESKSDEPHMLDGGVGKQPFDVAPLIQHEGGKDQ